MGTATSFEGGEWPTEAPIDFAVAKSGMGAEAPNPSGLILLRPVPDGRASQQWASRMLLAKQSLMIVDFGLRNEKTNVQLSYRF